MNQLFSISGYWKDDKSDFSDYIVSSSDDIGEDDDIFFYGISFEGKYRFTKQQVAHFFEVDIRTIERVLENHKSELEQSGYELYSGSRLKKYKDAVTDFLKSSRSKNDENHVPDIHVGDISQLIENELDSLSKTPHTNLS